VIWPKVRAARRIWGLLAGLGLITPCLFSAQVFRYQKIKPEKGYLIQTVPFEKWLGRNYCGPACLTMVLNYWDETRSFSQQKITDEIYDSEIQATYIWSIRVSNIRPRRKSLISVPSSSRRT
jgi:Peptidase_C39 like family